MRLSLWLALATTLAATPAFSFPWMVRHNYGSCATCHVDPSGAGQLTPYGRAQSDILLRWRTDAKTVKREEQEASPTANFLWFAELPDAVNLSGNLRAGGLVSAGTSIPVVPLIMATDVYATLNVKNLVAHVTVGPSFKHAEKAIVAPTCDPAANVAAGTGLACGVELVSREFWLGAKFADDAVMLRAGRTNLPFGLRNNEHNMWVRALSHTDINTDQQVGLSASYNSEKLRGEAMGIAGNFQLGPDAYRERGYSAFAEYALAPNAYLGLSSLIAWSQADLTTQLPSTRHAHGLFLRWAPTELVALLAEGDLLAWQTPSAVDRVGFAAMAQADFELVQGLHAMATLESKHEGDGAPTPSYGAWASAAWYAAPHLELRLDAIYRLLRGSVGAPSGSFTLLLQLHFFL